MKEIHDVHPLVALWLIKNGYSYTQEYQMPDYGRVDFYAVKNGEILLVEAKGDSNAIKSIFQVSVYRMQIPEAQAAIAIPEGYITEQIKVLAQKYDVQIVKIPMNDINKRIETREIVSDFVERIREGAYLIKTLSDKNDPVNTSCYDMVLGAMFLATLTVIDQIKDIKALDDSEVASYIALQITQSRQNTRFIDAETFESWIQDMVNGEMRTILPQKIDYHKK